MLISMMSGIAAPWAIYGIEASSWGSKAALRKFYGCAFPIDADGHFATCRHVLPREIDANEILVAGHLTLDKCFKVEEIRRHHGWDFAIFHCDTPTQFPYLWVPELNLGDDVFAYGYHDWFLQDKELHIVPQLHKGHVTATPRIAVGTCAVPLPWYQLSFPTPPGFSGSPIYHEVGDGCFAAGMIVESISSEFSGVPISSGKAISGLEIRSLARELGVACIGR
ncbi:MAG: serine protease [Sulfuritalea sp.]|nr:serine protease [Sulfuritalea sp.]